MFKQSIFQLARKRFRGNNQGATGRIGESFGNQLRLIEPYQQSDTLDQRVQVPWPDEAAWDGANK